MTRINRLPNMPIPNNVKSQREDNELKKACKGFETILVTQMLTKMRETVPKSDLFGSDDAEQMFQGMLDEEIAKGVSDSGALKISDLLYKQLSKLEKTAKVSDTNVDK